MPHLSFSAILTLVLKNVNRANSLYCKHGFFNERFILTSSVQLLSSGQPNGKYEGYDNESKISAKGSIDKNLNPRSVCG